MDNTIAQHISSLLSSATISESTRHLFNQRLSEGKYIRDENPESHFIVYFAAIDTRSRMLFMNHNKKANLWLFNGGHIDKNENPRATMQREMREEWGYVPCHIPSSPELLTITDVSNPYAPCRLHFDIWHFIDIPKDSFKPDTEKLITESTEFRWMAINEALKIVTDKSTVEAIHFIVSTFFI